VILQPRELRAAELGIAAHMALRVDQGHTPSQPGAYQRRELRPARGISWSERRDQARFALQLTGDFRLEMGRQQDVGSDDRTDDRGSHEQADAREQRVASLMCGGGATPVPGPVHGIDSRRLAPSRSSRRGTELGAQPLGRCLRHRPGISVDGTIDGDLVVWGQEATVRGHVTGDVILFVQSARIEGQVDGNVRGVCNNITVTGSVERNLMIWAQVIHVDTRGTVGRSITSFSQTLGIDGKVGRDMLVFNQSTHIAGTSAAASTKRAKL